MCKYSIYCPAHDITVICYVYMYVVSQSLQGVWIKGLSDAVCTAVNVRYRLLAFGKKK